jgi:hypothetical protein
MAYMIPELYKVAATKAAARWRSNPSPELKDQIMDSFRLTKVIQSDHQTGHLAPVRDAWKEVFREAGCLTDFDFDDTFSL